MRSLEDSIADSIAANTALALVTEVEDSIELPPEHQAESQSQTPESQSQFLRRHRTAE